MKILYSKQNVVKGALIYTLGDSIASFMLSELNLWRIIGMLAIGATFYALEIPNYFAWIDRFLVKKNEVIFAIKKSILAMLYFNPIWIARHLAFIKLFSGNFEAINSELFSIAFWSFLYNIPIALLANYIIQNKIPFQHRFLASAIFSGMMAIYYALSTVWFK